MKITIELDRWDFAEHFERFYERVQLASQMKSGRPVDRQAVKKKFIEYLKLDAESVIEEHWGWVPDESIDHFVDNLDRTALKTVV